jgi:hypothetical protein
MLRRLFWPSTFISASTLLLSLVLLTTLPPQARAADITGTILETMDASGYTYMHLDTAEGQLWVAIPQTPVSKGADIAVREGMVMKDFHSNSFDRTFDSIVFSPGVVGAKPASPHGKAAGQTESVDDSFAAAVQAERNSTGAGEPVPVQPEQGSAGSMGAIAPFSDTVVEKAEGDNSYTVAEIFARAKELNGTKVRIRGQVVKFNANIMGRNWLHLQDGSGDPMQNTHDLVVTTTDELNSPKVITIEGVVSADKDFGAGYSYAVIVEESAILSQ